METNSNVIKIINDIMIKYNVGRRPLSLILGLGEITITRYLNNDSSPDEKIIDLLKSVLINPIEYNGYLEKNKNNINISKLAYNKSKNAVDKLLSNSKFNDDKIKNISNYIINKDIGITNLKLQKLLYYCQLFSYVINEKPLFNAPTEAWQHGPVYKNIYLEFKPYGDNEIPSNNNEINLSEQDKLLVDKVVDSFGIYSGNVLCYFTHSEDPWKSTYGKPNDKISSSNMEDFAKKIRDENNISCVEDIILYSDKMINMYRNRK